MKFNVLIIDDELDTGVHAGAKPRREHYQRLSDSFHLHFVESATQLNTMLSSVTVHAVLLDFFLERWGTDARSILGQLPKHVPVGLISGHWAPNFEKLRSTLDAHRGQIAHPFTWDDLEDTEKRDLVVMWMERAIATSQDIAVSALGPDDPIRILHLSDIQFEATPPPHLETETGLLAQQIRETWGGGPTFIAITGDIAQHALPSEYNIAKRWFQTLATDLDPDWSNDRFLVVPGNHDVCWGLGRAARIQTSADNLLPPDSGPGLYSELKSSAFAPFRNFARELTGTDMWSEGAHHWVMKRFRHLGVVFGGFNSSEDLNAHSMPSRTLMDGSISKYFADLRAASKENDPLVLGLMHHPLCLAASDKGVANPNDFFRPLAAFPGTYVNLCGHVHASVDNLTSRNGARILEIIAPTSTKDEEDRPPDTARGFNLIELTRSNERVVGLTLITCRFELSRLTANSPLIYSRDEAGRLRD